MVDFPSMAAAATVPPVAPSPAEIAKRKQIAGAAEQFEASFLSTLVQQMFAGSEAEAPFNGGPGEDMFKSFLGEAVSKQMARAGGVGLAQDVQREMLKMQGLEP